MTVLPPILRVLLSIGVVAALWLADAPALAAAESVPAGAREALGPVTGIAFSVAVIVWGGVEKTLAGSNADAEHRAQRRIANGIQGLVWMILAGVIVSTITAIAVAYGLIERPF
jgi:hypothetical protein